MRKFVLAAVAAAGLFCAGQASAGTVTSTFSDGVIGGLDTPYTTISFASVGRADPITNQTASQGVTFSGALVGLTSSESGDAASFPGSPNVVASNWNYDAPVGLVGLNFSAHFAHPVSEIGYFANQDGAVQTVTLNLLSGGSDVGSVTLAQPNTLVGLPFYVVKDTTPFDQVNFTINQGISGFFDMNDFSFSPSFAAVPEPASWALMLVGFFGAGAMIRSRRRLPSAI